MRIKGQPIEMEVQLLKLPRTNGAPIELKVSSVGVGTRRDFDALYPRPKPPVSVTNVRGEIKENENFRDDAFIKAIEERAHLENVYMFWRVLQRDENVAFENAPTTLDNLRKLSVEISESGFSEGDMLLVLRQAMRASNISDEELNKARANF